MAQSKTPKPCACGCGEMTKSGNFIPGHDEYHNGRDVSHVPPDYAQDVKWFRLAAEQGHTEVQVSLGNMYQNGKGVPQDYVLAHHWFNLAAASGDDTAQKYRDIVAKRMTPDQIGEAQRMAREWLAKH